MKTCSQLVGAKARPRISTREYSSRSWMSACIRWAPSTAKPMNSLACALELGSIALVQQLQVADDHAQRLEEVVGSDIRELLQFGIRALQIRAGAPQLLLRPGALDEQAELSADPGQDLEHRLVRRFDIAAVELHNAEQFLAQPDGKSQGAAQAGLDGRRQARKARVQVTSAIHTGAPAAQTRPGSPVPFANTDFRLASANSPRLLPGQCQNSRQRIVSPAGSSIHSPAPCQPSRSQMPLSNSGAALARSAEFARTRVASCWMARRCSLRTRCTSARYSSVAFHQIRPAKKNRGHCEHR